MSFPVLPPDALDRELVFEFFWKFSAFECALKRAHYLTEREWAEADWARFAKKGKFNSPKFKAGASELIKLAPKKQMTKSEGGERSIRWDEAGRRDETDKDFALNLLRIIRNNLFHGGKYPDGPIEEIARNKKILQVAVGLIDECYALNADISKHVDSWIEELAA
jgi:hypothetical protein